jgi:hypothetical protein
MSGRALLAALMAFLLPLVALADDIVPNSIDCTAFARLPDGSWRVDGTTTFNAGAATAVTLSNKNIRPRMMDVGGADLFDVIETKCASSSAPLGLISDDSGQAKHSGLLSRP